MKHLLTKLCKGLILIFVVLLGIYSNLYWLTKCILSYTFFNSKGYRSSLGTLILKTFHSRFSNGITLLSVSSIRCLLMCELYLKYISEGPFIIIEIYVIVLL